MPLTPAPGAVAELDTGLLLRAGIELGFGADLDERAVAAFARYAAELVRANERLNLTRLTRPDEIATLHFLDALICLRGVPEPKLSAEGTGATTAEPTRLIDVGSGPGLPGLALKIVRPAWRVDLLESVGKKADFLRQLVAIPELGLAGCAVLGGRAEDLGRDAAYRAAYDLATARAVAPLAVLAEYLLPFLRLGGRALALKGADAPREADEARGAIGQLGGRLVDILPYRLPGADLTRHLVVMEKVRPTSTTYPRRAGLPSAKPLGG